MAIDNGRAQYTGTDWFRHDVPTMWQALEHHVPDAYAPHLAGWRKTSELLSQHIARMRAYRDNLAAAWNPHRSPAAALYLARFDTDIQNAQQTYDASVANYTTYAAVLTIVTEARNALKPIHEEYAANAAAQERFRQTALGMGGRAGAAVQGANPEVGERQRQLTAEARSVMIKASLGLAEATAALKIPPAYEGLNDKLQAPNHGYPPAIPPVTPKAVTRSDSPANSASAMAAPPPVLQSDSVSEIPPRSLGEPSLAGTGSPNLSAQTPSTAPTANTDYTVGSSRPYPVIGLDDPTAITPTQRHARNGSTPPGGIIGIPPNTRPISGSTTRTTASAGGVIGGKQSGGTVPMAPPLFGQPSSVRSHSMADQSKDPDNPWSTADGVPSVILPDAPQEKIDPGPAIGLP